MARRDRGRRSADRVLASDPAPEARAAAAQALGRAGLPRAAAPLERALAADGAMEVRRAAAWALGEVGAGSHSVASPAHWASATTRWPAAPAQALMSCGAAGREVMSAVARSPDAGAAEAREALVAGGGGSRGMIPVLREAITDFNWFVLAYFSVLSSSYLLMIALAAVDVSRWLRRFAFAGHDDNFTNPLTPGVSVLVPAFNEEVMIVHSVRALLALRYPEFEVIVVDDGSTDASFARLQDAFELVEIPRVIPPEVPTIGPALSTHAPASGAPLLVVRKENAVRRADALTVAINAARQPLVCMIDADSLLEGEALLRVIKPFIDDPRVAGTGGVIRAANGSHVEGARVVRAAMPRRWVERVQVLEYLRSFLLGRTGWSRLDALLIISGAFGVFRSDVVVDAGGLDLNTLAEDAELVLRIHRTMRQQRRDYRIAFVPEPVCWAEVPDTTEILERQRRRWSQGLAEVLWKHRDMMGNRRYGRIGLLTLPYYLLFELMGPVFEIGGLGAVVASFAIGIVNLHFALVFAGVAFGYGMFVSDVAVAVEEFSFHRYRRWRELASAAAAAALENVGYRQAHAWWRLQGLWRFLRGRDCGWGTMTRVGFPRRHTATERDGAATTGSPGSCRAG